MHCLPGQVVFMVASPVTGCPGLISSVSYVLGILLSSLGVFVQCTGLAHLWACLPAGLCSG